MGLKRADEIRTRMDSIRSDIATLEKVDQAGEGDETAYQRLDDLLAESDLLAEELKPLAEREQRLANITRSAHNDANQEQTEPVPAAVERGAPELGVRRSIRNPFENLEEARNGVMMASEVRSRALAAIEQYATRSDHWALDHDG